MEGFMNRGFEKISLDNFKNEIKADYNDVLIPKRSTKNSSGYDFYMIDDLIIKPNEIVKVPTGIKAYMQSDEVLFIVIRSSLGFKKNIVLANQMGVIDSDYYNNESNEGHIFIPLKNIGSENVILNKKDAFAQGIFTKYLTIDNEEEIKDLRKGGFGSTDKGELK
jgi:dUTP pyrophosphatase